MTAFVALLRAVNVGGTGKLPMETLRAMAEAAGFRRVRTYIASGNLLFESDEDEAGVKTRLEAALLAHAGKPVGVMVRTAAELAAVAAANPFPLAPTNRVLAIFLDTTAGGVRLDNISGRGNEEIALGAHEIYVHYADGIADSKLKIPDASAGTARNMNTVAKLAELLAGSVI